MSRTHERRAASLLLSLVGSLVLTIVLTATSAAEPHNGPPKESGIFEAYDTVTHVYTPLERVVPNQVIRGAVGGLEFRGYQSSVRLPARDPIVIVFARKASSEDDPYMGTFLFSVQSDSKSDTRFLPIIEEKVIHVLFAGIPGKTQYIQDHSRVPFTVETVDEKYSKLVPTDGSLSPGEYCAGQSGEQTEFCFEVEP